MNIFTKILMFPPTMISYLRGGRLFNERNYIGAIQKFEKCLKHPEFQNEQLFSFYGQALYAAGRHSEGHQFLLKACDAYDENEWVFEDDFTYNLAKDTLDALKHAQEYLGIETGNGYLNKKLQLKEK